MKKSLDKLALRKQTISNMDASELKNLIGGIKSMQKLIPFSYGTQCYTRYPKCA